MQAATVISYADDKGHPRAEVMLPNSDRVLLTLDRDGLAITQLAGAGRLVVLFRANPNLASRICAGLFNLEATPKPTPLRVLVAAVLQLGSAEQVRNAFRDVAGQAL